MTVDQCTSVQDERGRCAISHPDGIGSVPKEIQNPIAQCTPSAQIVSFVDRFVGDNCVECQTEIHK